MSDLRYWPVLLREIAEAVSEDAALRLAATLGGQRRSVPKNAEGSKLADEVGLPTARVIVARHGGKATQFPNLGGKLLYQERKRFILTNPQLSYNDCAERLGITMRRVMQIRADAKADENQLSLL